MRAKLMVLAVLVAMLGAALSAPASGGDSLYEFFGIVESLPSGGFVGDWTVAGKTVHVTAATEIDQVLGPAKVGATVRVRGTLRADGSVDAKDVEVKTGDDGAGTPARFTAVVESMPPLERITAFFLISIPAPLFITMRTIPILASKTACPPVLPGEARYPASTRNGRSQGHRRGSRRRWDRGHRLRLRRRSSEARRSTPFAPCRIVPRR